MYITTKKNSLSRRPRSNNTTLEITNQPKLKPSNSSNIIDNLNLHLQSNQLIQHTANALYKMPYKQNQLKYMYHFLCNAPLQTLIKTANNEQLEGIPFLKADLIQKYLPPSPETPKGRMKRPKRVKQTRQEGIKHGRATIEHRFKCHLYHRKKYLR